MIRPALHVFLCEHPAYVLWFTPSTSSFSRRSSSEWRRRRSAAKLALSTATHRRCILKSRVSVLFAQIKRASLGCSPQRKMIYIYIYICIYKICKIYKIYKIWTMDFWYNKIKTRTFVVFFFVSKIWNVLFFGVFYYKL